jgi:hypothetical protein
MSKKRARRHAEPPHLASKRWPNADPSSSPPPSQPKPPFQHGPLPDGADYRCPRGGLPFVDYHLPALSYQRRMRLRRVLVSSRSRFSQRTFLPCVCGVRGDHALKLQNVAVSWHLGEQLGWSTGIVMSITTKVGISFLQLIWFHIIL